MKRIRSLKPSTLLNSKLRKKKKRIRSIINNQCHRIKKNDNRRRVKKENERMIETETEPERKRQIGEG